MKKLYLFLLVGLILANSSFAKSIETDSKLVTGTLKNGMKYYIRHNQKPKDRADFYIIHNVGAILEEDNQDGLAHFTEHMAFNGTTHFPKKALLNYLEKHGVKFGSHINAFTAQDVTCYNLNDVPVNSETIIDSSLLILHDWSGSISFMPEEIDSERAVIHEEWRTRRDAQKRLRDQHTKTLFNNSKYARRDVIGTLDVIDHFDHQTLKDFYHDWYRPNLQAIVVVGDIDVNEIEKKVKKVFSNIPNPQNEKERYYPEVPNNEKPLISVATDPEATQSIIQYYFKHDAVKAENKNEKYLKEGVMAQMFTQVLNQRIQESLQQKDPKFISAGGMFTSLTRKTDAYVLYVLAQPTKPLLGAEAILLENKRMHDFGLTSGELNRVKADFLRANEVQYAEKDKQKNNSYVWKYFENFLTGEPIPGADFEYNFTKKVVNSVTLKEINKSLKQFTTKSNMVVNYSGPQKEGVKTPTTSELAEVVKKVESVKVKPYQEKQLASEIMNSNELKAKEIVSEEYNKQYDFYTLELENGVRVLLKKTDFNDDQILMSAYSNGGSSLYGNEFMPSVEFATTIAEMSGVDKFDMTDLKKILSGKAVSVSPQITSFHEGFSGNSTVKDIETMFQLIYLYFNKPRFDQTAFSAYMSRVEAYVKNQSLSPRKIFQDTINSIKYENHPRMQKMNAEFVRKADFNKIKEIYTDRFKDASDFNFVLVGNIEFEKVKALAAKYLANLNSTNRKENWKDNGVRPTKDLVKRDIYQNLQVDKSTVYINYNGEIQYSPLNSLFLNVFKSVLELRYTESIREREGGTYGVGVGARLSREPYENYSIVVSFDCDPKKQEKLVELVHQEIKTIIDNGPLEKDINKVVKNITKMRTESKRKNTYWLAGLETMDQYKIDFFNDKKFEERISKVTPKAIKEFLRKIDFETYIELVSKKK